MKSITRNNEFKNIIIFHIFKFLQTQCIKYFTRNNHFFKINFNSFKFLQPLIRMLFYEK